MCKGDDRDGLFFTMGSPGSAQSAADSFVNSEDNRRTGAGKGDFVGAAPVQNGLFCGFTDGVKLLAVKAPGGDKPANPYSASRPPLKAVPKSA